MNLTTIGSIPSSNLKHIKGQYLAAVAGVALAVSALVLFGPGGTTSKPVAPSRPTITRGDVAPQHTFIIAASVAQEAEFEAANSDIRSFDPQRNDITVLLAGSPAAQAFLDEGVQELMEAGRLFRIIDMTSVTSGVLPQPQGQASYADISASVLSTELANYLAPAETTKASAADVMASVISTEQATYGLPSVQHQALDANIMASVISTEMAAGYKLNLD